MTDSLDITVDARLAKGLLGRGGAMLTLAAAAYARGHRAGRDKWFALSPQMIASVEQVLFVLEGSVPPGYLAAAVERAMDGHPVTAIPRWARPIADHGDALPELGRALQEPLTAKALPPKTRDLDDRARGLAGLAVAFCRSRDTLKAIAACLPPEDADAVLRMARLAQATVSSGEPSRMRAALKRRLKELEWVAS